MFPLLMIHVQPLPHLALPHLAVVPTHFMLLMIMENHTWAAMGYGDGKESPRVYESILHNYGKVPISRAGQLETNHRQEEP